MRMIGNGDDMEGNRLFKFPKPQWLNSANTRNAGVYLSGALVWTMLDE